MKMLDCTKYYKFKLFNMMFPNNVPLSYLNLSALTQFIIWQ